MTCDFVKEDGTRCKNPTREGSALCWWHDPKKVTERLEAAAAGGRARGPKTLPPETPYVELRSGADLARLIELTVNQIRRGEIDYRIAFAMAPYVSVQRAILSDVAEERLTALEQALENAGERRGFSR